MEGVGKDSFQRDRAPGSAGSSGAGKGAFEDFLASAIATILTIIFSWRILLDSETGQLSIEPPPPQSSSSPTKDKIMSGQAAKKSPSTASSATSQRRPQVNIEQETVTVETVQSSAASIQLSQQKTQTSEEPHTMTANNNYANLERTTMQAKSSPKVSADSDRREAGSFADETTCVVGSAGDQYTSAPAAASDANMSQKDNYNSQYHFQPDFKRDHTSGLLPRPTWAVSASSARTTNAYMYPMTYLSPPEIEIQGPSDDSSGEETETEGDLSSDTTLECLDCGNEADLSDSDASLETGGAVQYYGDTREYSLGRLLLM